MKKYCHAALCAVALSLPMSSHAENLMDIFNLAIKNDPKLLAAQADRDAQKEVINQVFAEYLPTVTLNGSYSKNLIDYDYYAFYYDTSKPPEEFDLGRSVFNSVVGNLTLTQPILNLATMSRSKTADIQATKAELSYRIAQQELLFRIVENYFNVLRKTGDLNFARAEKNAIERQLGLTKARYDAGLIAVTDVHEAQARHDLSVAQEIMAENEMALAEEQMREITGITPKHLFPLRETTPLVPPTPSNINDWVNAAKIQNLLIAEAQMNADIAKQRIKEVDAEYYPIVDVTAMAGSTQQAGVFEEKYKTGSVSLNVKMNLFEGNRTSSKKRQAIKEYKSAQYKVEQLEREVLTQTRSAYLGVLAGMSYVKAISQAVNSSGNALKATEAGFDVATRSAIQVLDAQRELFRNQRDYAHARYDYILNTLRLKAAISLMTVDDVEQINGWLQ